MVNIDNLICLSPKDSYLVDSPVKRKGFLGELERKTGPFVRSPGVGYPYLIGFLRKNKIITDSTRLVLQHDLIEGIRPIEKLIEMKVDLSRNGCDVLFITAYTNSVREAYRRAREARKAYKAIGRSLITVLGGPHASAMTNEGTRLGHVDAIVAGEGEWAAAQLLTDVKEGRPVKPLYQAPFARIRDKNTLTLDMGIWQGLRPTPQQIVTSTSFARGCKLDCSFCAVKITNGELVRNRDYSDVVDEIRGQGIPYDRETISSAPDGFFNRILKLFARMPVLGKRYGDSFIRLIGPGYTNRFFFWDDNLYNARGSLEKLCEAIRPLGRPWAAQLTMDIAKYPALLKLAYESGCRELFLGIESVNQDGLDGLDKWSNQTDSMQDYIQRVHDAGIRVMGAFVFGLDGDDASVFDQTLEFVYKNGIDFLVANIIQPYPGTGTFQEAVTGETLLPWTACPADSDIAMDYNWPLFDGAHVLVRPTRMSVEELQNGYYYFLKEAYSLTGISRRFRFKEMGARKFPQHFVENYMVSRYSMNKTAYAIKKRLVKKRTPVVEKPGEAPLPGILRRSSVTGAARPLTRSQ